MQFNQAAKKFLGLYVLLLLLIPVTIFLSSPKTNVGELRSKAATNSGRIYFWPTTATLELVKDYDLEVRVETEQKPLSMDLVISFDPKVVMISDLGVVPGNMYSVYQSRFVDNEKGIVGLSGRGEIRDGNVFETLKIKTKNPGNPNFTLNYLNAPGLTLQTDLPQYEVR